MPAHYPPSTRGLSRWLAVATTVSLLGAGVATRLEAAACGPFTDVDDTDPFCPSILEIYYLGITAGISASTFGPALPVTRQVLAAMLARGANGVAAASGGRRASLGQFWTAKGTTPPGLTGVGSSPYLCKADGADIWAANGGGLSVSRVRASDGKFLETWGPVASPYGVFSAMGKIVVTGNTSPGILYVIDPSQPPGGATTVSSTLGNLPREIAFDGEYFWTANADSVSRVTPDTSIPWPTFSFTGYGTPRGILYDGASIWVTDNAGGRLLRLEGFAIAQIVPVGAMPNHPTFDGTNIWVPNYGSNSVTVIRASNGAVLATLTGNGLNGPLAAAFDGQRVLVTNYLGESISVWRAADLAALGSAATGASTLPWGACSDGINFWITLSGSSQLARF